MRKTHALFLLLAAAGTLFTQDVAGQIRGENITVNVTPDHKDWTYKTGEKINFNVDVRKSGTLLDNTSVSYEMGPEMYPEQRKDMTLKKGDAKITGKMSTPGFYTLKVTAHVDGKDYVGWCTTAVSPEKITPTTQCPDDFDRFWEDAIREARNTPLESHMTFLPEKSTSEVNTYHINFQNDRWGRRVYGILNVPVKPGRYPALLRVPGAGARPYNGDEWSCKQGMIVLEIGIHGVPVTYDRPFYDNLSSAALADYWMNGIHDKNQNYYKHVITGCVRAIDFIQSLSISPNGQLVSVNDIKNGDLWNGSDLAVTGSSQGGFLTLATTALDKRVSCYAAVHAAMCDYEAALKKTACGWPHYFYDESTRTTKANVDKRLVEQLRYYDGVNFARRIKVPGYFSFGYNDNVVPPTTAYATYNVVSADKTLSPYPKTEHFWYQEQWDEWNAFLQKHLNVSK